MWLERKLAPGLPPNIDAKTARNLMVTLLAACVIVCAIVFCARYIPEYRELYRHYWWKEERTLRTEALMLHFCYFALPLIEITLGFVAVAVVSVAVLYSSYYQGSRSIYLMHRLPDGRRLLRRQVWSVPLVTAALLLAAGALVLLAAWLVWRFVTPAQCLPTEENLQRVMNAMLTLGDSMS